MSQQNVHVMGDAIGLQSSKTCQKKKESIPRKQKLPL
jgi:hypothetical protein